MDAPLTTSSALLLALRQGPGYGLDLVRRVSRTTRGRVRLARGSVHRALQGLQRAGSVRCWTVVPGRKRGARARVYCELTLRGVAEADAQAAALRALVAPPLAKPSRAEARAMRERLQGSAEVSSFVVDLQDRLGKVRRNAS